MNEEKIKELEEQIKTLKEEKPRTDKEILESIEELLEKVVRRLPKTQASSIRDLLDKIPEPNEKTFIFDRHGASDDLARAIKRCQDNNPVFDRLSKYTFNYKGEPDLVRDPDFHNRQRKFRAFLNS